MNINMLGRALGLTVEQSARKLCTAYSLSDFELLLLSCQALKVFAASEAGNDFSIHRVSSID
jgi:hypothetical protein